MSSSNSFTPTTPRPERGRHGYTPYARGPRSIGWLIAGASQQAAPRFVRAMQQMPTQPEDGSINGWIAAIHSRNPHRAQSFAEQHQIAFHDTNLDTLLARPSIRAVYVANHPSRHAETVETALRAGKHVLCEPPIAETVEQAHALFLSAADRGLILAVNYQQHFDPAFLALRSLLANHELGDLLALHIHQLTPLPAAQHTWRVTPGTGGILHDRALRSIDVVRILSGDEIIDVQAQAGTATHGPDLLDDLHALLKLRRSRAIVHLHDSWNAANIPSRIEIYGTAGSATIMDWNFEQTSQLLVARADITPNLSTRATPLAPIQPIPLPNADLWLLSLLSVHEAIRSGNPPTVTAINDILALDVAHAIADALTTGSTTHPALASGPAQHRGHASPPTPAESTPCSMD